MKTSLVNGRSISVLAAAVLLVFATAPMAGVLDIDAGFMAKSAFAQGGKGGGKGEAGQKGGEAGKGQGAQGSKSLESNVLREGTGSGTGSKGGGSTSTTSVKLGRLSMAKAFLSPSFDPTKIDDPESPLAYLDSYRTALEDAATTPVTIDQLATMLAGAATAPITGASILKVNEMLNVTDEFTLTGISADALAELVNQLVKETHEE